MKVIYGSLMKKGESEITIMYPIYEKLTKSRSNISLQCSKIGIKYFTIPIMKQKKKKKILYNNNDNEKNNTNNNSK